MGCCFSRSSGPNSPYPGGAPDASSRAINPSPLALPEAAQSQSQPQLQPRQLSQLQPRQERRPRRHSNRPLDQHINKPLRRHEWTARDRTWSKSQLARERQDFFDTCVTGRPEIWQTIHAALQVLWDPVGQDAQDDGSNGLATAQMILSAAEISLPTGDLVNGVYDSLGNYYQLAEWIVCDPQNVIVDSDPEAASKGLGNEETTINGDGDGDDLSDDEEELMRNKSEKGKEVIDTKELVILRARLSENGQDIKLSIGKNETVKSVVKKIAQEANFSSTKRIRLAYMGKMLKENTSLVDQGWQSGHVINALVFDV